MSNTVLHKSDSRGYADHGWLKSKHTFSFADYYNPERVNFGALRVLNDDFVEGGMGFDTHPHSNMEIISIPLEGDLVHKDSMGNHTIITHGEVQVMSAGTGIRHSEYNKNVDKPVKFLQIWVIPNEKGVQPRYGQIKLNPSDRQNKLQQIVSPDPEGDGVWIHQDAWFHLGTFDKGNSTLYNLHNEGNGIYFFVLKGAFTIDGTTVNERDGFGVWNTQHVEIISNTPGAEILSMEVPMF